MTQADDYARIQARVEELVDDSVAERPVPTCPGWTVKDVVAHMAGFIDVYKRDGAQAFGPSWGDEVVKARSDDDLDTVLAEWRELASDPGDLFEGNLGVVAVSDALAHEQDIRTAIGRPGAEDDEAIVPSVQMALTFAGQKFAKDDLPAVKIETPDIDQQVGEGDPVATLRTSTFELFRTVHGRRTEEQARELDWEGDPGPSLPALFIFGPTTRPVE